MNRALKWKLIVGFVIVFLAGAMTGIFVSASFARHFFFRPDPAAMRERMRHRLRTELSLSDEQLAKISPIIDQTAAQLEEIRADTGRRVHQAFAEANREIAAELTPEQRAKLQKMEARHRRRFHHLRGRRRPAPAATPSPSASAQ
jgi:Spy/CpxP family protein refolding chaperone